MKYKNKTIDEPVLLFDGVCILCNWFVQKIIELDKDKKLNFATLQSDFGKRVLKKNGMNVENMDTVVLLDNDKIYTKSDAGLRIAHHLGGWLSTATVLGLLPLGIRNWVYDVVANNRYDWFGQKDSCMMPPADWKERFIA